MGKRKNQQQETMKKLLIATNNKGKVLEFQELLKNTGIEFVTPAQISLNPVSYTHLRRRMHLG